MTFNELIARSDAELWIQQATKDQLIEVLEDFVWEDCDGGESVASRRDIIEDFLELKLNGTPGWKNETVEDLRSELKALVDEAR